MSKWTRRPDGKTIRRKSLRISGQFAPRCIDMQESPAYRVLNLAEHRILARIEIELAHHGGLENGDLPITYEQFIAYGIRRNSIAPAIRTVVGLGFVRAKLGRGGNSEFRRPNLFGLTYRHFQKARYGDVTEPTDDWRRIGSLDEARHIAEMARSEKTENRYTKRGAKPVYETGGENENFSVYETGGTGSVTKRRLHLESRGGGGDADGYLSNSTPSAGSERSAPINSAVASERPAAPSTSVSSSGNGRLH
jgi:hypothetical protein